MAKRYPRIRRALGSIFRIRSWIDADRIGTLTSSLYETARRLFVPPHLDKNKEIKDAEQEKRFDKQVEQLHLSEAQLRKDARALLYWSYTLLGMSILLFALAVYYTLVGTWKAVFLTLVGVGLALILAFRYHFFSFQIRHRKLGCSVKAWFEQGVMGRRP